MGFVAAAGSGGAGNANVASDLQTLNETAWASFDADPLAVIRIKRAREVHILRYHASCSGDVNSQCTETIAQAKTVALLNHGLIWELGNEPGVGGQDDGGAGFVSWENSTYKALKSADPSSLVLGPGVLDWDDGGWNGIPIGKSIYDGSLWGNLSFDAVAFHVYPSDICMASNWRSVALSQVDQATSAYPSVYLTETGDQSAECAYYGYTPPADSVITANFSSLRNRVIADGVKMALFFLNRPGNQASCPTQCSNALLDPVGTTKTADGLGWSP